MADHRYEARGVHGQIFDMTDREILITGPEHTGSPRACMEKLMVNCQNNPGTQGMIVRKVEKNHAIATTPTLERRVLPELINSRNVQFYNGNTRTPQRYQFSNGSSIVLAGIDDPRKFADSSFDMIVALGATDLEQEDWESLSMSLAGTALGYTQLLGHTLPQWPTHWLYLRAQAGMTCKLDARHEDNPDLFDRVDGHYVITDQGRAVIGTLRNLTGVRWLRNGLGLWAPAEGLIYTRFNSAVHVIKPYVVPNDWARVWGIDWGKVHAFSWGNWVREPDGRLVMFQEIHMTGRDVEDHIEQILDNTTRAGQPRPEKIICDHDLDNIARMVKILSKEWGFDVRSIVVLAKKSVKAGIDAVDNRLKQRYMAIMHGCLLEVDQAAQDLGKPIDFLSEVSSYVWADEKKDQPLKRDDDAMDMARYVIMEEDAITSYGVRMKRKAS
jgi:phage terminase large subunit